MSEEEEEGAGTFIDTSGSNAKTTPPPAPPAKEKRRDGAYIIIIILLLLAGGLLGWKLSERNEMINICENERDELTLEMEGLNEMMYDQGLKLVKMSLLIFKTC